MTTHSTLLSRALLLSTFVAALGGCPAVEPVEPEPEHPTPRSGTWALHVASVDAYGDCAGLGRALEGRIVAMDVAAHDRGDLEVSLLGLGLHGGHGDGMVWASASVALPDYGDDVGIPVEPGDGEDGGWEDDEDGEWEDEVSHEDTAEDGREPAPPPCEVEPEPWTGSGIEVSLDADLVHAERLEGALNVWAGNGWASCSLDLAVDAVFVAEDGSDDHDLPRPLLVEVAPEVAESAGEVVVCEG